MYRAVLFDFFGVIHEDTQADWMQSSGIVPDERFAATAHQFDTGAIPYAEYLRRLGEASGQSPLDIAAHFGRAALNQEVVTVIETIGQNLQVGLLSNANAEELDPILSRHDLRRLFGSVTISSEVGLVKPDHAIFKYALASLGAKASETIFVDDRKGNVRAAEQLGMRGVHFKNHTQLARTLDSLTKNSRQIQPTHSALIRV